MTVPAPPPPAGPPPPDGDLLVPDLADVPLERAEPLDAGVEHTASLDEVLAELEDGDQ